MGASDGEKGDVSAVGGVTGERDGGRDWSLTGTGVYGGTEEESLIAAHDPFPTP